MRNYHHAVIPFDDRCQTCFDKAFDKLIIKFDVNQIEQKQFIEYSKKVFMENKLLSAPEIQEILNNEFCKIAQTNDLFIKEKKDSNQQALAIYPYWKSQIEKSKNPYLLALKLALAGNIIDYGANHEFDLNKTIEKVLNTDFAIDHSQILLKKIRQSKHILYLGDNSGEIVFDKLFIETIAHKNVSYAVKSGPVLNDATLEDAKETGIDKIAKIIENGTHVPSTLLTKCSEEFIAEFESADLIISKGQGNLEGLYNLKDQRLFFLLMIKCDVIAELLKLQKGDFIVLNSFHYKLK